MMMMNDSLSYPFLVGFYVTGLGYIGPLIRITAFVNTPAVLSLVNK